MRVPAAEFIKSAVSPADWPPADLPELAFAGRSNCGKSRLINMLVERRGLVRTSSTPGRTRQINFFRVEVADEANVRRTLRLVDLPGFGYAKVSKEERATWRPTIEQYLTGRPTLAVVALLVDARRGAELDETELAPWIASHGIDVVAVLTKADKLAKHERRPAAERVRETLGMRPIITSAENGEGREALWKRLLAALPPQPTPPI